MRCPYNSSRIAKWRTRPIFEAATSNPSLLPATRNSHNLSSIRLDAFRDMNLPKFIKDDERLFRLLLGDLFPSLELPVPEYGALQVSATCCYFEVNNSLSLGPLCLHTWRVLMCRSLHSYVCVRLVSPVARAVIAFLLSRSLDRFGTWGTG